jgi:hypothetical protein
LARGSVATSHSFVALDKRILKLEMLIDKKFHIDIRGGHVDIERFNRFRKILIAPTLN